MGEQAQVDQIAAAVTAVPGVAGLHGGMFGEVATYLPGRRIPGIRIAEQGTDVHVSVQIGAPVRSTAAAIRRVVSTLVQGPVNVTVEDVVPVGEDAAT
ncbi:MAG: hypothetical protein DI630_16650 [Gordonia sp. (in: high G+C Gram-positive bacteria)]|nr:MAG: hypothetical protein DI630_16650 [Gordonia sp. (in: high G+C Gram-positive bacteria)]